MKFPEFKVWVYVAGGLVAILTCANLITNALKVPWRVEALERTTVELKDAYKQVDSRLGSIEKSFEKQATEFASIQREQTRLLLEISADLRSHRATAESMGQKVSRLETEMEDVLVTQDDHDKRLREHEIAQPKNQEGQR